MGDVFGASPNAAMVFEGNFVANTIPDVTKSAVPKAPTFDFPAIGGSNPLIVGGDAAVLFTNNQAGKALIKYLATPQAAEDWASAGGFISPNKNLNLSIYPRGATQDAARKLIQAKTCYFGLSDLQPPAFGATEGKGMWKIFQEFLANPEAVDTIAGALEAGAKNEWGKTRWAPLTASGEPCG